LTLARVTGLPEATVFAYGRFAREAGYIAQGGRGRGGARMTATDAANLIIAIGGTRVTRDAGKAIKAFRALRGKIPYPTKQVFEPIQRLIAKYRLGAPSENDGTEFVFGSLMDFLITESMSSELQSLLRSLPVYDAPYLPNPDFHKIYERFTKDPTSVPFKSPENINILEDIILNIEFSTNWTAASVYLSGPLLMGFHYFGVRFDELSEESKEGDLSTTSSITQRTIFAAARCVADLHISTGTAGT
jgi:hypothetical protein